MPDVKIRNLDDHTYEVYRQRAAEQGTSLEEQLRTALRDNLLAERRALVERLRAEHDAYVAKHGYMPDSTPEIRADRDLRG
jgi:plasmid stability protein